MASVTALLLEAASQVPFSEYVLLLCAFFAFFLYHALELHFFEDLFTAFRGHPVQLLFNASSSLASLVLPHCHVLHRRYWPTPWLCSPHVQTAFLHFFGRPPRFDYKRQLCRTPDGGTVALDWLYPRDYSNGENAADGLEHQSSSETRIAVIVPGLTSDSSGAYIKHIAFSLASTGYRVVVANHRGLGGVSITSKQFYNAGWTVDLRQIINHLHQEYPKAPLLAVGTSIGANILVKYLGEEGENTPLGGAAAICCPWDLLVCDRFICRKWVQRFYDKILAFGLRNYAALHQVVLSQLADWDLISKCHSVRDFDNHCTCVVGQYETVDTYYRKNSSASFLPSVAIPLLCISSLDDPVCTKEAIPWDECRVNANVVLGVTKHGGHLAFFEGLTARSIWWARATTEFLENLCESSLLHVQKHQASVSGSGTSPLLENVMDKSPYLNIPQSGVVAAEAVPKHTAEKSRELLAKDEQEADEKALTKASEDLGDGSKFKSNFYFPNQEEANVEKTLGLLPSNVAETESQASSSTDSENGRDPHLQTRSLSLQDHSQLLALESTLTQLVKQVQYFKQIAQRVSKDSSTPLFPAHGAIHNSSIEEGNSEPPTDTEGSLSPQKKPLASVYGCRSGFSVKNKKIEVSSSKVTKVAPRRNGWTLWLLAYVAIVTTWPLVGSALFLRGKMRFKNVFMKLMSK